MCSLLCNLLKAFNFVFCFVQPMLDSDIPVLYPLVSKISSMVRFSPGFCFWGVALDETTRTVVNVCGHDSVGRPLAKNMTPVDEQYIDERGLDNLIIPISVSQPVELPKSEAYNYRVDVVVHTVLTKRCVPQHHFFKHYVAKLTELSVEWVKQECGIILIPSSCTFVGDTFYDVGSPKQDKVLPADLVEITERMMRDLKESDSHGVGDGDVQAAERAVPEALRVSTADTRERKGAPLVQEVVADKGLKKGFLLAGNAQLYGANGSPEGNGKVPDPLAHIPQSIRERCKVIDTRTMKTDAAIQRESERRDAGYRQSSACDGIQPVESGSVETPPEYPPRWKLESVSISEDSAVIRVEAQVALSGVSDVVLTVSGQQVDIDDFHYTLPRAVDDERVKAKFVKSTQVLVLTCPFA